MPDAIKPENPDTYIVVLYRFKQAIFPGTVIPFIGYKLHEGLFEN